MSRPVAIVTGASSGIGRACAIALAHAGHDLTITARRAAELDAVAEQIKLECDIDVHCRPADLTDLEEAASIVDESCERFGRLDVVLNNAGLLERASVSQMTLGVLQRSMVINAFAPAVLARAAWDHLAGSPSGVVINISSVSSIEPLPELGGYGMSKLAIEGLTKSIQIESDASQAGIRAFAVAPGAVDTQMLRTAVGDMDLPEGALVPMHEIVGVILDCIRGDHDQVGGGVLYVPGPGVMTLDREKAMAVLAS
ncbi:MAG: SDR family NAD(P)-dependent oxidoreductase, partial [Phycisphaerales bacterium]|nr:SDR family NAD(P)-dependent oxidoreductase [Phycisphaerales bacterium]